MRKSRNNRWNKTLLRKGKYKKDIRTTAKREITIRKRHEMWQDESIGGRRMIEKKKLNKLKAQHTQY